MGNILVQLNRGDTFRRHVISKHGGFKGKEKAEKSLQYCLNSKEGMYFIEKSSMTAFTLHTEPVEKSYETSRYNYDTKQYEPRTATYTVRGEWTPVYRVIRLTLED